MTPSDYLQAAIASAEFASSRLQPSQPSVSPAYDPATDEILKHQLTPDVQAASQWLSEADGISFEQFNHELKAAFADFRIAMPTFGGQDGYVDQHRMRFFELTNVILKLLARDKKERSVIIDVGWSVNTLTMQRLAPDADVRTLDRPHMPLPPSLQENAILCDLAAKSLDHVDAGVRADVIVFAEVIEHLLANPVKVMSFLLRHLVPGGRLVITTPNFFRTDNMNAIVRRDNPQPTYPYDSGPDDAPHFHIREYCMRELLLYAVQAGGEIEAFFFSGCWDDPSSLLVRPRDEWSNMLVVVRKPA